MKTRSPAGRNSKGKNRGVGGKLQCPLEETFSELKRLFISNNVTQ